jgi:LPS-assembly lipoprotein
VTTFAQARLARRSLLLAAGLALSGCGFQPVYAVRGKNSPARHEMGRVDIGVIPERYGQLLRQALQQRLNDPGEALAKTYELSVSFSVSTDIVGIQQDATATRIRETGSATWSLKRLDPGNTLVTSGTARALDGVNIIDQQYFEADLAQETAQKRLAESVADQITLQLGSYFNRHAPAS